MDELELSVAWQSHVSTEQDWLDSVLALHRQPHRRYHTVRHVRWVVRHAIELAAQHADRVSDLGAVIAAAFFHDAVYEPERSDNEAASAALARRALRELGWSAARVDTVASMIEATAGHAAQTAHAAPLDTAVLLAADLAVLGADPASYAEYATGVRAEYAFVPDAAWRTGRAQVLRSFIDRPAIYEPQLGLDVWERRARANLAAELTTLGG